MISVVSPGQNKPEKNSEVQWKVILKGDQVKVSKYQEIFQKFILAGFYNCTINGNICSICGFPKQSNLPKTKCWREQNHKKLKYTDGVHQIGFYYNKKSLDEITGGDLLSQHMNNLYENTKFVTPLALAMVEIAQTKYKYLLEADLIIPVPSFYKDKEVLKKGDVLASELHKFFGKDGKRVKLERCIKKTQKVSVVLLERKDKQPEEIAAAIKYTYKVSDDVDLAGKKVLLVDDNLTSGLTAGTCAEKLKAQGAEKVWVFVAGRTK
jgi:predicted amidophosphoribosyltransferase